VGVGAAGAYLKTYRKFLRVRLSARLSVQVVCSSVCSGTCARQLPKRVDTHRSGTLPGHDGKGRSGIGRRVCLPWVA
jgi:hypothetical protein